MRESPPPSPLLASTVTCTPSPLPSGSGRSLDGEGAVAAVGHTQIAVPRHPDARLRGRGPVDDPRRYARVGRIEEVRVRPRVIPGDLDIHGPIADCGAAPPDLQLIADLHPFTAV